MTTKRVEYAYATSPNAVALGHGKTGCWVVELVTHGVSIGAPNAIAAFATRNEARAHAETMPEPWDRLTK